MKENKHYSRGNFIQTSAVAGAALVLADPLQLFSNDMSANIKAKGYAGMGEQGKLVPWNFERRAVGDNDILIAIKFSGICHSDIHTVRGHWGKQQYPLVPGHEIAGIVMAVGKNVTKFKIGDKAGVGCMVDSCMECESCKHGEEHYCDRHETAFTYGFPDKTSPSGITQGGYANNLVVRDHFAIRIPDNIDLQHAAPLLCSGITTYSPLIKANFKRGDKVGIAGIGGLGHIAVKLAASKGADVYAFTTSPSKVDDIKKFGAKEVIVVDSLDKLKPYYGKLDFLLSTIPYAYDISFYANVVKPYGTMTQVGMPIGGHITSDYFQMMGNRVNINASMIGGIPETQEVMNYCADNNLLPEIQIIHATEINDAWEKVVNKAARYRYVIDAATF
ncbi:NAD(P)-dependent alcohol dehydrogenase [Chitinophaga sancti]|uniref:NAD(P)-dependent alcohol dehydrogenase n=1 Tax=Chitinophaga sancti TaxID=1004 RepID=UPI003F7A94F3